MYTILESRILLLNGAKIVYQLPLARNRTFSTAEEIVEYKRKTIEKNRERLIKKWRKQHPGSPDPEVELLLKTIGEDGYMESK